MKSELKKAIESKGLKVYGELIDINGELFPLPLTECNGKIGRVMNSSTAPGTKEKTAVNPKTGENVSVMGTCPADCKGCYAQAGRYRMNRNMFLLIMRTRFLREYPEIYGAILAMQLDLEKAEQLRIHAAGDFIEKEARMYYDILKDRPSIKTWTYTKHEIKGDIALLDSLENVNIVKSIIPGFGFNYGHADYIAKVYKALKKAGKKVYICRCGIDPGQHCENCSGCSSHEYVLFIEHSTGYNVKKDPNYKMIHDLIESQK
jgi:hypothetical protein